MGKKKFIAKGEGQHFYLLHRSQTDEAYAGDQRPSDFVLVAAQDNGNERRKQQKQDVKLTNVRDHITPLGFKNDGYDYSQHLKEMGGGRFIGRDGSAHDTPYGRAVELPADALPSEGELDRRLEAVTLSHEVMDDDLRAALFDDADEGGGFEELQDDFVAQVMEEPDVPDFDFDAHIAELIARSEQSTQRATVGPRGWDSAQGQALLKKGQMKRGRKGDDEYYEDDSDYVDDVDDDDDDEWSVADDEDEEEEEGARGQRPSRGSARGGSKFAPRATTKLDEDFDRLLEDEYDDGQVGYIDEGDEEELQGGIDVEGGDAEFDAAMEEYLQDAQDSILAQGVSVKKGARALEDDVPVEGGVDVKEEAEAQRRRQEEAERLVQQIALAEAAEDPEIVTCQEYLREERVREEYDCESIISTYSTLDNHPSVIKEKGSAGYKPYKSRHSKLAEAEAAIAAAGAGAFMKLGTDQAGSESSALSGYSVKGYLAGVPLQGAADGGGRAPTKIVLKGKLGLPEGYGPVHHRRRQGADDSSTVSSGGAGAGAGAGAAPSAAMSTLALSSAPSSSSSSAGRGGRGAGRGKKFRGTLLAGVKEEGDGDSDGDGDGGCAAEGRADVESGDDEEDDDDDSDGSDGSDDDEGTITSTASTARLRGETPEQRKARKALVKEEKRAKRATKKQLKLAYKDEFCRQILISGRQQSLNNTSVFKYSV